MEFGSKFVFNYSDSEEEVVSDEEFQEGFTEDAYDVPNRFKEFPDAPLIAPPSFTPGSGGVPPGPPPPHAKSAPSAPPPPPAAYSVSSPCSMEVLKPRPLSDLKADKDQSSSNEAHSEIYESADSLDDGYAAISKSTRFSRGGGNKKGVLGSLKKPAAGKHHWQQRDHRYENVKGRKCRRADTNIVSIKFGHLTSAGNMHTGDPVYCQECGAVLSHLSQLAERNGDTVWVCEYCSTENVEDLASEEVPTKEDLTFMLLPAPTTTAGGRLGLDEMLVVFCIDVSGSMCVTTEVPGKVRLRGDRLERLQSLNTERESQYLPGQRRNTTYVSRLQGVQAAVDHQLSEMAREHPDRRVALVTFNNEVTAVGDGSGVAVTFSGDKLKSWDDMKRSGEELTKPQPIKKSRKTLSDKLFDLEEGGQTALGPALLMSVALASGVSGSKVIICTDGMANIGLGALDNISQDQDLEVYQEAHSFYANVSQLASDNGVSISVTTIKGTDCKLMELGQVASNTHGQVNIVDPLKLTEEFGNILADATIATNVEATLVLHKGLYFRNEDNNLSKVTKHIGNVNKDTEITFEYGVRRQHSKKASRKAAANPIPEEQEMAEPQKQTDTAAPGPSNDAPGPSGSPEPSGSSDQPTAGADDPPTASAEAAGATSSPAPTIKNLDALPFQVQIRYTDTDGGQAMRVLTQKRPLTKDRSQAEQGMNAAIIGVHGAKRSATMAMEGDYTGSRLTSFMHQRLMARNYSVAGKVYDTYLDNVKPMENCILQKQQMEIRTKGHTHSDSDDSDEEMADEGRGPSRPSALGRLSAYFSSKEKRSVGKKKALRRLECSDASSVHIYKNYKNSSTSEDWKSKDKK